MKFVFLLFFLFSISAQSKPIELTSYNTCSVESEVDEVSMFEAKKCLSELVFKRGFADYPLYLVLNSPGGSVYNGLRFIEFAKTIPNLHTVTIFSASMAAAIVQHLPGKRYVTENGIMMFHRARGTASGQFDGELETRLNFWKRIVRKSEIVQANRIGITLKEYKKRILNEWWIYGKDNVTENTADEVSLFTCSKKLIKETETKKVETIFGTLEYKKSKCPLLN